MRRALCCILYSLTLATTPAHAGKFTDACLQAIGTIAVKTAPTIVLALLTLGVSQADRLLAQVAAATGSKTGVKVYVAASRTALGAYSDAGNGVYRGAYRMGTSEEN